MSPRILTLRSKKGSSWLNKSNMGLIVHTFIQSSCLKSQESSSTLDSLVIFLGHLSTVK